MTRDASLPISFERDIKPLFSGQDRREMEWAFDLWSYDDVRSAADRILERVEEGSMPCDREWDDEKVQLFRDWIAGGSMS